MKDSMTSKKGVLMRELIAEITSTHHLGESIQTGKYRKHPIEPPFIYPAKYQHETIMLEHFSFEYLRASREKSKTAILQLHGGGYIGPMKNAYRRFSIYYHKQCQNSDVVTVDYRVAPEHPYPAALMDALTTYRHMIAELGYAPKRITIAGDSAGGGLAVALCLYLRDHKLPLPGGLILMSPWCDLTNSGSSHIKNFEIDPLFGNSINNMLYNSSYIGSHDPKNPYISPLFGDMKGLPPMLIQVGTHEVLLSDSTQLAKKAKESGIKVRLSQYEGMFHVFQMSGSMLPESKAAWREVGQFFQIIQVSDTKPSRTSKTNHIKQHKT